jgi:hypothetical protein
MRFRTLLLIVVTAVGSSFAQPAARPASQSATVPLTIDHNRLIIDVRLALPDGTTKRVRCWVDNGNPELWIGGKLAQTLGLHAIGEAAEHDGVKVQPVQPPASLIIGGMTIPLKDIKEARAVVGREPIAPGLSPEINLPATVLRNYEIVVDYLNRDFTLAEPGALSLKGIAAKGLIDPQSGLIQLPSKIGGAAHPLGFDLGASYSFLSEDLLQKLQAAHPQWPHMTGAVGAANMWGAEDEAKARLLRIPAIRYGPLTLTDIGFVSFPTNFPEWSGKRAGFPSAGLLGGNAFLNYRVGIDYPHSTVYFEQTSRRRPTEMEVVGLILRPEADDSYRIAGVADYQGKPSVAGAKPGDILVAIDGTPAKGGTMGQVWSLLEGAPGDVRTLTLARDGKQFNVKATVRQFLKPQGK